MLRGVHTAIFALCLLGAHSAHAQVIVSEAEAARAAERSEVVSAASRRVTEILMQITGDPAISSATNPNTLAAAIEAKAEVIVSARDELRALAEELEALPPIADGSDPAELRLVSRGSTDAAELVRRADAILENLQTIPPAVRSGDQSRFNSSYRSMASANVLMQEAQAANLRSQAALMDSGDIQRPQFLGVACFSDGQAALQAGMSGLQDRTLVLRQLSDAEACVRENVAHGRESLAAEPAQVGPQLAQYRALIAPLDLSLLEILEDGADLLASVADSFARNENSGVISATFNPSFSVFAQRLQQNTLLRHQFMSEAR
jgi:hypothetical protein